MRKLLALCRLFYLPASLIAMTGNSQPVSLPRTPSPAASVSQTIGISKVEVNYSRPSVKQREVWGKLVPFGWNVQGFGGGNSAPWRAGANENTTIKVSHDAKIEGTPVPAGEYGLFFVINQDNSGEVILSKDSRHWGSFWYDPKQDQLRANIKLRENPFTEMLTYDFINNTKTSSELVLNWEKKQFPVRIEFDVDKIVMANAAEELKNSTGFDYLGYLTAANYALQNKLDYEQALKWIDIAIQQRNDFRTIPVKADILRAMNRNATADSVYNAGLLNASEVDLNAYGYNLLLGQGKQDKAIEVFIYTTKRFPKSANAFDSLGEGYAIKGDNKNAILNFKKSLSMNPPANVKANSEKYLKQLGAL